MQPARPQRVDASDEELVVNRPPLELGLELEIQGFAAKWRGAGIEYRLTIRERHLVGAGIEHRLFRVKQLRDAPGQAVILDRGEVGPPLHALRYQTAEISNAVPE